MSGVIDENVPGFRHWLDTPTGRVPVIATQTTFTDRLGAWKVRWAIGRNTYQVPPGLYAVGSPDADSPVLVTANYKMSYDILRGSLTGRSLWILVLETYGINVWCAAGKGTFGTGELVRRVGSTRLAEVVNHRTLILPLLGAPGVRAPEVAQRTGFRVRYSVVRATDLPGYLDAGMQASEGMRSVTFTLPERLVLTPVDSVLGLRNSLPFLALLFFSSGITAVGFSGARALAVTAACIGALLCGTFVTPILLPWLPSRSFAVKGAVAGATWWLAWRAVLGRDLPALLQTAVLLLVVAVSSFFALNFTGSTPFTSRSGVRKEMRLSLPVMACLLILAVAAGIAAAAYRQG